MQVGVFLPDISTSVEIVIFHWYDLRREKEKEEKQKGRRNYFLSFFKNIFSVHFIIIAISHHLEYSN